MALFQTTKEREARQCPPPPAAYPWLLFYYGNGFRDQSFHTISHPPSNQYYNNLNNISCVRSVPELCNKVVWNSCHGWLILSDDDNGDGQFSLFNPVTLEYILLPPSNYNLDPQTAIDTCTLSSPPTDPSCMLFVFYIGLRRILMCRLENKHWIEKRYDEEIEAIDERPISNKDSLRLPVFCKGKLYASTRTYSQLVSIDVVEQDPINLVLKPLGIGLPWWKYEYYSTRLIPYLVESDGDIYCINLICGGYSSTDGFRVNIFKLDLTSVIWERMESVKDRVFFLCSKYAISCATDQVGGTCVYFTWGRDKSLYAYNIEDDSVSVFLPCPNLFSPWKAPIWVMPDLRLTNDDCGKAVHINGKKRAKPRRRRRRQRKEVVEKGEDEKILEAKERLNLLDLPSDILKSICRLLVPVDYMKFLAVSTMTRRLAPHSEWRTAMSSPWLVNFERNSGVFSLVDPYHNNKYHVRVPKSLENVKLCCCKDGWLLMCQLSTTTNPEDQYQPRLIFFNPFTKETIIYPTLPLLNVYLSQFGFSSSPSSSNCAVVAVSCKFLTVGIYTSRSREEEWCYFVVQVNIPVFDLDFMSYPIFVDGAFYFMSRDGRLGVLRTEGSDDNDGFSWEIPETTPCKFVCWRNFLVECDGELLSVFVPDIDERRVKVFKLNSNTLVWKRVHSLGNRTLYISHSSALSAEAKNPKMEEKIYIPRFYEQAIVSYSLATGLYHYSSGSEEGSLENYYGTRHQTFSGWIVPRWL